MPEYLDGEIVKDGKVIKKLHPPPPPSINEEEEEDEEEEHPKRKNISVSYETWRAWKDIKENKKWDTLLKEALDLFNKVKEYEDIIKQIALQKSAPGRSYHPVPSSTTTSARKSNATSIQTIIGPPSKLPFMEELKKIIDNLDSGNVRDALTKVEKAKKEDKKRSDEEIERLKLEANIRSLEMKKKNCSKQDLKKIEELQKVFKEKIEELGV